MHRKIQAALNRGKWTSTLQVVQLECDGVAYCGEGQYRHPQRASRCPPCKLQASSACCALCSCLCFSSPPLHICQHLLDCTPDKVQLAMTIVLFVISCFRCTIIKLV